MPIAIYDACVLYSAPLRDLLMHLALTDMFRAKWTDRIHEEWIRSVLKNRQDLTREKLERTRDLMNLHARDCLVEGYEYRIPSLTLPDPDDRHVLAAAIQAQADAIVTLNLKHYPDSVLQPHGTNAQHPDDFVTSLIVIDESAVCSAVRQHRKSLQKPPKTVKEYLETLECQSLPKTVMALSEDQRRL